jgi:hypothetical protein
VLADSLGIAFAANRRHKRTTPAALTRQPYARTSPLYLRVIQIIRRSSMATTDNRTPSSRATAAPPRPRIDPYSEEAASKQTVRETHTRKAKDLQGGGGQRQSGSPDRDVPPGQAQRQPQQSAGAPSVIPLNDRSNQSP